MSKTAHSQATWALLMKGVTDARIEVHRLRHLVHRGLKLIEGSDHKDHFYQVAGDLIAGVPKRIEALEGDLDMTHFALSRVGEEDLKNLLSLADRVLVDEALKGGKDLSVQHVTSARRVASLYMGNGDE